MMFSSMCSQVGSFGALGAPSAASAELESLLELELVELDGACLPSAGASVDSPDSLDVSQIASGQHFPLVQVNPVLQVSSRPQSAWKKTEHTCE